MLTQDDEYFKRLDLVAILDHISYDTKQKTNHSEPRNKYIFFPLEMATPNPEDSNNDPQHSPPNDDPQNKDPSAVSDAPKSQNFMSDL